MFSNASSLYDVLFACCLPESSATCKASCGSYRTSMHLRIPWSQFGVQHAKVKGWFTYYVRVPRASIIFVSKQILFTSCAIVGWVLRFTVCTPICKMNETQCSQQSHRSSRAAVGNSGHSPSSFRHGAGLWHTVVFVVLFHAGCSKCVQ